VARRGGRYKKGLRIAQQENGAYFRVAVKNAHSDRYDQRKGMTEGTYITDITHFLDATGEMSADLPKPAASLASFLTLIIDATTETGSSVFEEIGLRCRTEECTGSILSRLESEEIIWHCPTCGHNGIIRNWQATKWNHEKS
jgi:predicted RNA-binding Zn-ribbon protein involved in translation (DUF1610 family)